MMVLACLPLLACIVLRPMMECFYSTQLLTCTTAAVTGRRSQPRRHHNMTGPFLSLPFAKMGGEIRSRGSIDTQRLRAKMDDSDSFRFYASWDMFQCSGVDGCLDVWAFGQGGGRVRCGKPESLFMQCGVTGRTASAWRRWWSGEFRRG